MFKFCFHVSVFLNHECTDMQHCKKCTRWIFLAWSRMMNAVMDAVRRCDWTGHLVKAERSGWWGVQYVGDWMNSQIGFLSSSFHWSWMCFLLTDSQIHLDAIHIHHHKFTTVCVEDWRRRREYIYIDTCTNAMCCFFYWFCAQLWLNWFFILWYCTLEFVKTQFMWLCVFLSFSLYRRVQPFLFICWFHTRKRERTF